jgi:hypothetical protein
MSIKVENIKHYADETLLLQLYSLGTKQNGTWTPMFCGAGQDLGYSNITSKSDYSSVFKVVL